LFKVEQHVKHQENLDRIAPDQPLSRKLNDQIWIWQVFWLYSRWSTFPFEWSNSGFIASRL